MGDDENIVTTFYVEGELSLCWDRETGEFVSLCMNSTLHDDISNEHFPLGSSVALHPSSNISFDHRASYLDIRKRLPPASLTGQGGLVACAFDSSEASCTNLNVHPLGEAASSLSGNSSVPVATVRSHATFDTTTCRPPSHELESANGLCNAYATERKQMQNKANSSSSSAFPSVSKKEKNITQTISLNKKLSEAFSNYPTFDRANNVPNTPVTNSQFVIKDSIVSVLPTTSQNFLEDITVEGNVDPSLQKVKENMKKNDPVLAWEPSSKVVQSTELYPLPVNRELRPNLSPWFYTPSASCRASQASHTSASTPSEKSSTDSMPTSCSSIQRTGHDESCSMSSKKNLCSSTCTVDTHGSHCLRSSCKDRNCQANLQPSSEKASNSSVPNSRSLTERSGYGEPSNRSSESIPVCSTDTHSAPCVRSSCKDGNCRANMAISLEKSSSDNVLTSRSSTERTELDEASLRLSKRIDPLSASSTDRHCPYCLRSSCKDGNCRANLIASFPTSGKTAASAAFGASCTDEVSKPLPANKKCKSSLTSMRATKEANDRGTETASPSIDAQSGFSVLNSHPEPHHAISPQNESKTCTTLTDEPFMLPYAAQQPCVKDTLQWQLDNIKQEVFENSEIDDSKPEVSFSGTIGTTKKEKGARTNSDFAAIASSSRGNGKITSLFTPVDEKPTLLAANLPLPSPEIRTSLPLDFFKGEPAILNTFIDSARLLDFANTFLSLPAAAKQKTDPTNPVDIIGQQSTKSGKRLRDAVSRPADLPTKKIDQTASVCSLGNIIGTSTIPSSETSPVSPRPVTAKSSKRPRIGDLSSSKHLIPKVALHTPLKKMEKRSTEREKLVNLNDDAMFPSKQPEPASSSHQPHFTHKGGKNSLNLSDAYSGNRHKRRKTLQYSFRPMDCCRPRNAFILYSMKERRRIAAAHPHSKFGEISKLVARTWCNMSDAEKKPYRFLASEEANKYHNEVIKSRQTWERLAARGLQLLYAVDFVSEWLSQKLPKWAKYLSSSSMDLGKD
ncbi:hypothetical protein L7F22_065361 [Adiantum nelumboides]|nr:hypothetical protein [Adiantum nelumboides]